MINKNSGFTLVELLISISILSMLLFTGTYAYQTLSNRWDKSLTKFDDVYKVGKNVNLLRDILTATYPSIIFDLSVEPKKPTFFFEGSESRLLSITRSGLLKKVYPEIYRILITENRNEKFNLVYQTSSSNEILLTAQQEIIFDKTIILLEDLDSAKFSYYGWDSVLQKGNSQDNGSGATWRESFSAIDNQLLPNKIKVDIQYEGKSLQFLVGLDQDSLRYLSAYIKEG